MSDGPDNGPGADPSPTAERSIADDAAAGTGPAARTHAPGVPADEPSGSDRGYGASTRAAAAEGNVPALGSAPEVLLVDEPAPHVRRLTLNRPEKRNALSHQLRAELINALHEADGNPDVRVMIVRGAGPSFSAGYELGGANEGVDMPHYTAEGEGQWPRHVTETWMGIWDLAKPVIAQVHGYCLAGGSELATGCDLVYVAHDAKMGYPAVRFGVPDMHFHAWMLGMRAAMEMMVTGDSISGDEAVRLGWANRAFDEADLDDEVLAVAERVALIPTDIVSLNKRTVHRAMDAMGMRAAIRQGTELCSLGTKAATFASFIDNSREQGLTKALQERDAPFGDYRTGR